MDEVPATLKFARWLNIM